MLINNNIYGCSYGKKQKIVDSLCPEYLKYIKNVPESFKKIIDEIF
tara:strand:- start:185 stop:322 length:138 start_codon:yes stop_codon:yes gene_type:complete